MSEQVLMFYGEAINETTEPRVLLDVISTLNRQLEQERQRHRDTLDVWSKCRKARKHQGADS